MQRILFLFGVLSGACGGDDDPAPETFEGLSAEVEIRVDTLGVPHIYASTDADAFYASGYQMATDRLWQMDVIRRRAYGRRAEVFGQRFRQDDQLSRLFDFANLGRRDAEQLEQNSPSDWNLVVAWTAGVNARIDEVLTGEAPLPYGFGPEQLDYEPERWEPEDGLVVGALVAFGNSSTLEFELVATAAQNLVPDFVDAVDILRPIRPAYAVPAEARPVAGTASALVADAAGSPSPRGRRVDLSESELRAEVEKLRRLATFVDIDGSNNWAVAGRLSENGRPLLAADPHQGLDSPSVLYAQHLNSAQADGSLDVIGWSFVGTPGVQLGHNNRIVWSATNNFGDSMDIWEVPRVGADAIRLGEEEVPLEVREETIRIRQQDDSGQWQDEWTEEVFRVETAGDRGTLMGSLLVPASLVTLNGGELLFDWTGYEGTRLVEGFFGADRAQNVAEFEDAMDKLNAGAFNYIAADASSISYYVQFDIPDRGSDLAARPPYAVLDGRDPATLWTGDLLGPEQMPRSRDPEQGWVATANNDPWGFTDNGRVDDDPWYYGAFFAPGLRADRIESELTRLADAGAISIGDLQSLQIDVYANLADELIPLLEAAWSTVDTAPELADFRGRPELQGLIDQLGGWDRQMRRESPEALVFNLVLFFAAQRTLADDLSVLYELVLDANSVFLLKMAVLALTGGYAGGDAVVQEGADLIVVSALADTAELLTERFGGVDPTAYRWGDVHGTFFDNPAGGDLEIGFVSSDGGADTVNPSASDFLDDGEVAERFEAGSGSVYRLVASFAEDGTPEAQVSFPPGNSGDPASPHFRDLLEDWVEGRYRTLPYRRADVEAATDSMTVLPAR